MTQYRYHTRAAVSLVTAIALVLPPGALVFSAQAPGAATPAKATKPAAAPKASATGRRAETNGWSDTAQTSASRSTWSDTRVAPAAKAA